MRSAGTSSRSRSTWPISFAESRAKHVYVEYEIIATAYGFGLAEMKEMSPRERRYWVAMADYRASSKA